MRTEFKLAFIFLFNLKLYKAGFVGNNSNVVLEVPYGENVVLQCKSNDYNYLFEFWLIAHNDIVIGPSNEDYDIRKFQYEVLSGKLFINAASEEDSGLYSCVSRELHGYNMKVESIKMRVIPGGQCPNAPINTTMILTSLISIILLAIGCYVVYKLWKDRSKYSRYTVPDAEDDEESGEEMTNEPSTSRSDILRSRSLRRIVLDKRQSESYDNPDVSTDFQSILEIASNK